MNCVFFSGCVCVFRAMYRMRSSFIVYMSRAFSAVIRQFMCYTFVNESFRAYCRYLAGSVHRATNLTSFVKSVCGTGLCFPELKPLCGEAKEWAISRSIWLWLRAEQMVDKGFVFFFGCRSLLYLNKNLWQIYIIFFSFTGYIRAWIILRYNVLMFSLSLVDLHLRMRLFRVFNVLWVPMCKSYILPAFKYICVPVMHK